MRAPRWATAPHLRPRTVRLRLTAIYSALFLLCGAALLAITYVLVENSTDDVLTYTSKNGGIVAVGSTSPGKPARHRNMIIRQSGHGPKPLNPAQMKNQTEQMLALARHQHQAMLNQLLLDSGIALGVVALVSVGLGWIVAGRVLRPLRTMTNAVRDISATNLHRRLATEGPRDELTELGDTFNGLLGRLETAFQAQRQFVANASHELRTPLARQRAIGQVALSDPDSTVESLRVAHERVLAAGAQQERLIAALLALARGQTGVLHRERLELAELVNRVLAGHDVEAAARGVRVEAALTAAPVLGDPRLLEALIVNLVENALRHNVADGRMTVFAGTDGGQAVLRVSNTGPVVPPDEVERLLQPFHRLSPERGVHGDGVGIGLSIVQAVSSAHGAELALRARPDGGLEVEVAFAEAPAPDGNAVPCDGAATERHTVVLH